MALKDCGLGFYKFSSKAVVCQEEAIEIGLLGDHILRA